MNQDTSSQANRRVAFVTGGGRGIGRAIAVALGGSGHDVAIGDLLENDALETIALIEQAGGKAIYVPLDVSSTEAVQAAIAKTKESLGAVEVLVNVAGYDKLMPFTASNEEFWKKVVDINYLGVLRMAHAVLPDMLEKRWGRIISIASDAARVGSSFEAVYAGAKGAVVSFTKTLARETARKGVTCNSICPGPTRTPGFESAMDVSNQAMMDALVKAVPMGRMGTPEDIGPAVAFLASDGAGFITGQTLSVSGGLTMA